MRAWTVSLLLQLLAVDATSPPDRIRSSSCRYTGDPRLPRGPMCCIGPLRLHQLGWQLLVELMLLPPSSGPRCARIAPRYPLSMSAAAGILGFDIPRMVAASGACRVGSVGDIPAQLVRRSVYGIDIVSHKKCARQAVGRWVCGSRSACPCSWLRCFCNVRTDTMWRPTCLVKCPR